MYFDNFSKMLYDFAQGSKGENQFVLVNDITKNVRFRNEFIKGIQIYEPYKMKDGETIEIVSEKLYGTPDYHWILMLLNERFDYIEDFPLDGQRLDEMITEKYKNRQHDTRYYVDKNHIQVTPDIMLTLSNPEDSVISNLYLFDNVSVGTIVRRQTSIGNYTGRINSYVYNRAGLTEQERRQILNVDSAVNCGVTLAHGQIKIDDIVQLYKYYDDADGNFVEEYVGDCTVLDVVIPSTYTEVTNYEYEYLQNEKKRIIKVIPQQYLQQIVNEFESLIK